MNYTIKEAAKKANISAHTLRYYEKVEVLPPIARDKNGNRLFTNDDITWISMVYCLRSTEMPISVIKQYVELSRKGDQTVSERRTMMVEHKQRIEKRVSELETFLKQVNDKVEYYDRLHLGSSK